MSKIKKIIIAIIIVIVIVAGYFAYQLFVLPKIVQLPVPENFPRQSVNYLYTVQIANLNTIFGAQKIKSSQLGEEILKDMRAIKNTGFDGVKINYGFRENNYIAERVALKAAQTGLYTIGTLQGHRAKPKGIAFTDKELADWEEFVRQEVRSSKNTVYFWEVWNEPSVDLFLYGSPEEYVALLKATYPIIKKENPQAKVIATLDTHDPSSADFANRVLALGGGNYIDILSVHPYAANPYIREDVVASSIAGEKELAARYGNRWPIVIGEIGQPTSEVSEDEQARLAQFVYKKAAANNMPVTWFYWSDQRVATNAQFDGSTGWGLLRTDGSERPVLEKIRIFLEGES